MYICAVLDYATTSYGHQDIRNCILIIDDNCKYLQIQIFTAIMSYHACQTSIILFSFLVVSLGVICP